MIETLINVGLGCRVTVFMVGAMYWDRKRMSILFCAAAGAAQTPWWAVYTYPVCSYAHLTAARRRAGVHGRGECRVLEELLLGGGDRQHHRLRRRRPHHAAHAVVHDVLQHRGHRVHAGDAEVRRRVPLHDLEHQSASESEWSSCDVVSGFVGLGWVGLEWVGLSRAVRSGWNARFAVGSNNLVPRF